MTISHVPKKDVIDLYLSGRSVAGCARDLGISSGTVHAWVREAGVMRGVSEGLYMSYRAKPDVEAVVRTYQQGRSLAECGAEYGMSSEHVHTLLRRAGVAPRTPKQGRALVHVRTESARVALLERFEKEGRKSIRPCPFCGSPGSLVPATDLDGHRVHCANEDCVTRCAKGQLDADAAIKLWNTRVPKK